MRVLLIDSVTAPDVLQTKAMLVSEGHEVQVFTFGDTERWRRAVQTSCDVVVTDWVDAPTLKEIVKHAERAGQEKVPCIVCSAKATPAIIEAALRAGADDFLRKPYPFELLSGTLGRIERHLDAVAAAARDGETKTRQAASPVLALSVWQDFAGVAARALAGVTMLPMVVDSSPGPSVPWLAAVMNLSVPRSQLECRAVVDGDQSSVEKLAMAVLGNSDAASAADLLKEIVNNTGGAFMRGASLEEVDLTSGLPEQIAPRDADRVLGAAAQTVSCWISQPASGARLRVRMGVRIRKNRLVRVLALREGMVLARDLQTPQGTVLLTSGTRITSSSSDRVRKILAVDCLVEVADTVQDLRP